MSASLYCFGFFHISLMSTQPHIKASSALPTYSLLQKFTPLNIHYNCWHNWRCGISHIFLVCWLLKVYFLYLLAKSDLIYIRHEKFLPGFSVCRYLFFDLVLFNFVTFCLLFEIFVLHKCSYWLSIKYLVEIYLLLVSSDVFKSPHLCLDKNDYKSVFMLSSLLCKSLVSVNLFYSVIIQNVVIFIVFGIPFTEWYKVKLLHLSVVTVFIWSALIFFLVFNQNFKLKDVLEKEKRFGIFVFYMIQPRVIDLLFSCYSFKTLKY